MQTREFADARAARGDTPARRSGDWPIAGVLCIGTALYLSLLPHTLNGADESYFLFEARRIREGEVLYRDIFNIVPPLAPYVMAGLFWLFGTTIATARIATACLHGITGAALYLASRRLRVRNDLALLVPLAYVVVCQPVWPYASWHWFSSCGTAVFLLLMVAEPRASLPRRAFVLGLINGILIGVQHQKGLVLAAATSLVFVLDFVVDRVFRAPSTWRGLAARLAAWAVGVAAVMIPLLILFVLLAGAQPIYRALVRFPLENYRTTMKTFWGTTGRFSLAEYTYPRVLKYSPLALSLPIAECAWDMWRGRERLRVRQLSTLIVLSAASIVSILYYPDVVHIAFIAGILWVAAAAGWEWVRSAIGPLQRSPIARALVSALFGVALILQLVRNARLLHQQYPIAHQTAFGRVAFGSRWEPLLIDKARELLVGQPTREIFCYPQLASPYLTIGGRNPTPYQFLLAGISPDDQVQEALRILEVRRVPYVIGSAVQMRGRDPIVRYIQEHYESVPMPQITELGEVPLYALYRRKNDDAPPSQHDAQ